MCVYGRSCQGLIECLYMTSSCWGLGCALGKVENNERRTAAKHNRIHLYLPTAARALCVDSSSTPPTRPLYPYTRWENRFNHSCTRWSMSVCVCMREALFVKILVCDQKWFSPREVLILGNVSRCVFKGWVCKWFLKHCLCGSLKSSSYPDRPQ